MKVPAIRAKMGTWTYYVSTLTFEQVAENVRAIDDELHKSKCLSELIQRSIKDNVQDIQKYLLRQPERLFNALILAIYDGSPDWIEVELTFKDQTFLNLGFIEFLGNEKIFPVDGQHRVEGIKAALKERPELKEEKISVIFIGHSKTDEGMKKSRRLFSTLNSRNKQVTLDDIIALDEDDSVAIVTRNLIEDYDLFKNDRIVKARQKAIPETETQAITSIITLYQCNKEIVKYYFKDTGLYQKRKYGGKVENFDLFLKYRPDNTVVKSVNKFTLEYWNAFKSKFSVINEYLKDTSHRAAIKYRNKDSGGSILFRPVGLLPFVKACMELRVRRTESFNKICKRFDQHVNLNLNEVPWIRTLWDPINHNMIMGSDTLVKLMLMYLYSDGANLRPVELENLKKQYAAKMGVEEDAVDSVLDGLLN